MAFLSATVYQDAIVNARGRFGSFEKRMPIYGALQAFKDDTPKFLPPSSIEAVKTAIGRATSIPVLNKFNSTLITVPTCTPTGGRPTSALVNLTWAFIGFETKIIPCLNANNQISMVEDLGAQMVGGWKKTFDSLDDDAVDQLEADKSASLATSKNFTQVGGSAYNWDGTVSNFLIYVPALMCLNQMTGPYNNVTNCEAASTLLYMQTYGQNNQQNLAGIANGTLPGALNFNNYISPNVDVTSDDEVHYLFPEGSVGVFNWINCDYKAGRDIGIKDWSRMQDPYFGFDWQVLRTLQCEDLSGTQAGLETAYTEVAQIGAYFAFLTDYSSDTSSPIIKVTVNGAGS